MGFVHSRELGRAFEWLWAPHLVPGPMLPHFNFIPTRLMPHFIEDPTKTSRRVTFPGFLPTSAEEVPNPGARGLPQGAQEDKRQVCCLFTGPGDSWAFVLELSIPAVSL